MLDLGTLAAHIRLDGAEETEKKLNGLGDSFSDLGKQFGGIKLPSGLQDGLNSVGESITGVYNSVKGALPEGLQKGLEGLDSAGAAAAQQLGIALPEGMGALLTAGAAVAAAVVAVGVALWDCANAAAAYGDAVDKGSQKMGISAEAYQEWSYVLERNGSSIDTLQVGMKTLDKQIAAGSESFDTLGVSLTNADGSMRSTEDVMNDTLLALAGMEDGAERTALATELFGGRVAQDLNPMLNSGAEGIEALKQRAEDLNIVMSDQGVADSAAFSDAMTDLNLTIDGLKNTIGVALLPVLTTIINVITSGIAIVSQAVSAVISFVGSILGAVGKLAAGVGQGIGQVVQWFGQLPSKISSTLSGLPNLLINAGKSVIDGFKRGLEQAWNGVTGWFSKITSSIPKLKGPEDVDKKLLYPAGQWIMEGLENGIVSSLPSLRRTLAGVTNTISGTDFNATAQIGYSTVGGSAAFRGRQETTYNVYINGTRINDDAAIESKFAELMMMLARKGSM